MEIKEFIKKLFCKHHYIKTRELNLNEDWELFCIKCNKRKKIK
jgi:hypothetical protein